MVGKIKRVRQKLHQGAVKLLSPDSLSGTVVKPPGGAAGAPGGAAGAPGGGGGAVAGLSFPSGIFAGTRISPEALVQTLKFEESAPDPAAVKKEPEDKKSKSKREKMKERRERWLNKIGNIIQTKERQRAEAQRRATPVVGDMRPLADALPELGLLIAPAGPAAGPAARRKSRKTKPVKRATPTDFSQMKPAHKRKLLEAESSLFSDSLKTLSTKTNPLLDIGEQLRKRMRQEEEQRPS